MSVFEEGCQLNLDEIVAVMALAGKKSLVGFRSEDVAQLSAQRIWEACAGLMRDAMMTQIDGKFRLSRDLMKVMQPVCQAVAVIAVTPCRDQYPQQMLYRGETVTAMLPTPFGRYLLRPLAVEKLPEYLVEELELSFPEEPSEAAEQPPMPELHAPREILMENSRLVLEAFHPETGVRTGWVRICEGDWIQWSLDGVVCCDRLSRETLEGLLHMLMRGEKTA